MSCVIGIDPSLTSTGVVALDESGNVVLAEAIRGAGTGVFRLIQLRGMLYAVLGRLAASHPPVLAVLEGYGYSPQAQRLAEIGEWVGTIKLALWEYDARMAVVPPARLKKFAAGRGNAQKDEMRLAVFKRWTFEARENDLVDAYALAQLGRALLGWETNLTKAQWEVVEAIRAQGVRS